MTPSAGDAAVPPRCDHNRGQRGGQSGSPSSSHVSCVASAGRGAGLRPSGCSSRIMPTILSSTCSSPGLGNLGRGAATRCSAGDLASSRVAGSKIRSAWRSGAHGAVGSSGGECVGRAGAARRQVGESSLALRRQACSRKRDDSLILRLTLPSSHMHACSLFILRWCRTIRVVCTVWVP